MKSLRLTLLLGAILLHGTPAATLTASSAAQIGVAEITGVCPANCKLIQSVSVSTAEDGNGIRVGVEWTTSPLPTGVEMVGFNVSVKLVLKDNKTIESNVQNHGPTVRQALLIVQGPATNRNINLSDIKSGTAIVKANAKTPSGNAQSLTATSKEIIGDDGAEVNMRVRWTPPAPASSPCFAERTVVVRASAENAGGIKFEGTAAPRLSAGTVLVRLRGFGIRRQELKNLHASLEVSPVFLTCGSAKLFQSFSGTGSNP